MDKKNKAVAEDVTTPTADINVTNTESQTKRPSHKKALFIILILTLLGGITYTLSFWFLPHLSTTTIAQDDLISSDFEINEQSNQSFDSESSNHEALNDSPAPTDTISEISQPLEETAQSVPTLQDDNQYFETTTEAIQQVETPDLEKSDQSSPEKTSQHFNRLSQKKKTPSNEFLFKLMQLSNAIQSGTSCRSLAEELIVLNVKRKKALL